MPCAYYGVIFLVCEMKTWILPKVSEKMFVALQIRFRGKVGLSVILHLSLRWQSDFVINYLFFFVRFDHNAWQEDGNMILLCLFVTDSLANWMTDYITDWMIVWMSNLQYQLKILTNWAYDWLCNWVSDWLTEWLRLINWLNDWLTE